MSIKLMIEKVFTMPKEAFEYAKEKGKPIPELEPLIARNAYWAYHYARDILKGRFELGEKAIKEDKDFSSDYDQFVQAKTSKHKRLIENQMELNDFVSYLESDDHTEVITYGSPNKYPLVAVVSREIDHSDIKEDKVNLIFVYKSDFME